MSALRVKPCETLVARGLTGLVKSYKSRYHRYAAGRGVAKGEKGRLLEGIIVLVRNTTWKCGRVERAVLECLQNDVRGRGKARIKDLLRRLEADGRKRSEFLDAIRRLERRRIVRIELPQ